MFDVHLLQFDRAHDSDIDEFASVLPLCCLCRRSVVVTIKNSKITIEFQVKCW